MAGSETLPGGAEQMKVGQQSLYADNIVRLYVWDVALRKRPGNSLNGNRNRNGDRNCVCFT